MRNIFLIGLLLLSTVSLAGILPTSRGGTGANVTPAAGAVVYSTSSGFGATSAGTANQVLKSNGTSAPSFSSSINIPSGGTVYLAAGGTLANQAPIYVPAGSTMNTAMPGAIESNGTNLYWTDSSGNRYKFNLTIQ